MLCARRQLQFCDNLQPSSLKVWQTLLLALARQESAHVFLLPLLAQQNLVLLGVVLFLVLLVVGRKGHRHSLRLELLFDRGPTETNNIRKAKNGIGQVLFHPGFANRIRRVARTEFFGGRFGQGRFGKLKVGQHAIAHHFGNCPSCIVQRPAW